MYALNWGGQCKLNLSDVIVKHALTINLFTIHKTIYYFHDFACHPCAGYKGIKGIIDIKLNFFSINDKHPVKII